MSFRRIAYRFAPLALLPAMNPVLPVVDRPLAVAPIAMRTVVIRNFAFVPRVITVAPGTQLTWTNADEDPHTVTANDQSFRSAAMDSGDTFSFTFASSGTFAYFCSLHPHMVGKVVVTE